MDAIVRLAFISSFVFGVPLSEAIDSTVQVAFVSIFGVLITTSGVVAVAVINNRKERAGAASAGVDAGLDEKDILERMLSLIDENRRKENTIEGLKQQITLLIEENNILRDRLLAKEE